MGESRSIYVGSTVLFFSFLPVSALSNSRGLGLLRQNVECTGHADGSNNSIWCFDAQMRPRRPSCKCWNFKSMSRIRFCMLRFCGLYRCPGASHAHGILYSRLERRCDVSFAWFCQRELRRERLLWYRQSWGFFLFMMLWTCAAWGLYSEG